MRIWINDDKLYLLKEVRFRMRSQYDVNNYGTYDPLDIYFFLNLIYCANFVLRYLQITQF
jgi:hypothetical protein